MNQENTYRVSERRSPQSLRNALVGAGLLAAGVLFGSAATQTPAAWGDVKNAAPDQHFHSGDQLALPLLQEIATTLHQMDARLARLETAAQQMQMKHAAPTTP